MFYNIYINDGCHIVVIIYKCCQSSLGLCLHLHYALTGYALETSWLHCSSPSITNCLASDTRKVWLLSGQFQWFFEAVVIHTRPQDKANWLPIYQFHPLSNCWVMFDHAAASLSNFSFSLNTIACTVIFCKYPSHHHNNIRCSILFH